MRLPRGREANPERVVYGLIALLSLIVIYLVAFVLSNTATVPVSFVFFETDASLIWVMLVCTLLGLVAGIAISRLVSGRRAAHGGDGRTQTRAAATARPSGAVRPMPAATSGDADTDPSPPAGGPGAPPGGTA